MKNIREGIMGSAVRLDELPPQYRNLKFLGRGATTIAFERDADTVYIFTRDAIKKDWLVHGLHMVSHWEIIEPVRAHHVRGMGDLSLYMLIMPKLFKLNPTNAKVVAKEIRDWKNIAVTYNLDYKKTRDGIYKATNYYEELHPNSKILPFLEWLLDYDPDQYGFDIAARQFKQTAHGEIVLLDPVVDAELMKLFRNWVY
jgi:hypothetical protein